MRVLFAVVLLMSLTISSVSQEDYTKHKALTDVVKVNENLYYGTYEVTNNDWLEYLKWNRKELGGVENKEYQALLPDTLIWKEKLTYNEPYVNYYLRHPAYKDYPVVGVSWRQASEYCAWRTARVQERIENEGKTKHAPPYFQYRLPSYNEFMLMYEDLSKLTDRIGEEGPKAYRDMLRWNMKRANGDNMGVAGKLNDNADITAPSKSYWPNQYGAYTIKGNVSEWVMEQNTHVGGSWNDLLETDVTQKQILEDASPKVGFRCVCQILDGPHP